MKQLVMEKWTLTVLMFLRLESFDAMSGCSDIVTEYTLKTPDVSFYKDATEATEVELHSLSIKYCSELQLRLIKYVVSNK